jgi:hypothetical protein
MWESGRKESVSSCPSNAKASAEATTFEVMFPWVSITPLGSPVVPEV